MANVYTGLLLTCSPLSQSIASMSIFILATLVAFAVQLVKSRYQKGRIALLAGHLGNYQIEKLMETLTEGYMRALGELDNERRSQIWQLMHTSEAALSSQLGRFAAEFSKVDGSAAQISRLPSALAFADRLLPGGLNARFDVREAFAIHARGVASLVDNRGSTPARDHAFTLSAELFLLQHTCHWFCKSQAVASARLMGRHRTTHAQVLASVSPATRADYRSLTGL